MHHHCEWGPELASNTKSYLRLCTEIIKKSNGKWGNVDNSHAFSTIQREIKLPENLHSPELDSFTNVVGLSDG